MKRPCLFFVLLLVPVMLTACYPVLQVAIFNNTGDSMEVFAGSDRAAVAPGQYGQIDYPQGGRTRVIHLVRIFSNGCEYLYDISSELRGYPGPLDTNYRGIQVQVEKDFSIDLLPGSYKGNVPVSNEMVLKQDVFPLRPMAQKCN